jgi:hypothetical protein
VRCLRQGATRLAIGVEGGFLTDAQKYDVVKEHALAVVAAPGGGGGAAMAVVAFPDAQDRFPTLVCQAAEAVIKHQVNLHLCNHAQLSVLRVHVWARSRVLACGLACGASALDNEMTLDAIAMTLHASSAVGARCTSTRRCAVPRARQRSQSSCCICHLSRDA